jgi:hypothetical protein
MAHHPITDKNGKPTEYFWSDDQATDPSKATVFRKTETGDIKKMTGVTFDSKAGKIVKG